jgi:hypothetical protein
MDSYWKEWWRIRVIPTLIDGLFYELYDEPRHAVVVERMGGPTVDGYSGNINIPEQVEDDGLVYPVTSIGESAFDCCTMLNAITIPKSISTIGPNAFMSCEGLTSIVVDADNQTFDSRENCNAIIESSTGMLLFGSNASTIPEGVTAIADNAFRNCTMLSSLRIPSTLLSVGKLSFSGSGIRAISVAEGNPKFDSRDGCNAIIETASNTLIASCKNTIIPNSVESIGNQAFCGSEITTVNIPSSVTSIGDEAFAYCDNLTSITIPSSVTSIGNKAFFRWNATPAISIVNLSETPQKINEDTFWIHNGTLHVLPGCKSEYGDPETYWSNFTIVDDANQPAEIIAVYDMIAAIGKVENTTDCKALIDAARSAYDALPKEQQALVKNFGALIEAETAYEQFGTTGITTVETKAYNKAEKYLVNGKIVIVKNGKKYNLNGQAE